MFVVYTGIVTLCFVYCHRVMCAPIVCCVYVHKSFSLALMPRRSPGLVFPSGWSVLPFRLWFPGPLVLGYFSPLVYTPMVFATRLRTWLGVLSYTRYSVGDPGMTYFSFYSFWVCVLIAGPAIRLIVRFVTLECL